MTLALRPGSLGDLERCLQEHRHLVPVAGATSLLTRSRPDLLQIPAVLDLSRVPELRTLDRTDGGGLRLGATATTGALAAAREVARSAPALAEAARFGGWQVRNRATLGGNLAAGETPRDLLTALMVLDAEVVVFGPNGERCVSIVSFCSPDDEAALRVGEVIVRVQLPAPPVRSAQGFRRVSAPGSRRWTKLALACLLQIDRGRFVRARLAVGAVGPRPRRLGEAESALIGRTVTPETAQLAAGIAVEESIVFDDRVSTALYRRRTLERLVRNLVLELSQDLAAERPEDEPPGRYLKA